MYCSMKFRLLTTNVWDQEINVRRRKNSTARPSKWNARAMTEWIGRRMKMSSKWVHCAHTINSEEKLINIMGSWVPFFVERLIIHISGAVAQQVYVLMYAPLCYVWCDESLYVFIYIFLCEIFSGAVSLSPIQFLSQVHHIIFILFSLIWSFSLVIPL